MPTKHATDRTTGVTWSAVSGVQPIVYVARRDDRPVAILEVLPTTGVRLTACNGQTLGEYGGVEEGRTALERWLRERT